MLSARWSPRLLCGGTTFVVVRHVDASARERAVAASPADAETHFRSAFMMNAGGGWDRRTLGDLVAALRLSFVSRSLRAEALLEIFCQQLRFGSLLLIELERIPAPEPMGDDVAAVPALELPFDAPAPKPFTWIEIEVRDRLDKPMSDVRLRMLDTEGKLRNLTSDEKPLRVDLPEGLCRVEALRFATTSVVAHDHMAGVTQELDVEVTEAEDGASSPVDVHLRTGGNRLLFRCAPPPYCFSA